MTWATKPDDGGSHAPYLDLRPGSRRTRRAGQRSSATRAQRNGTDHRRSERRQGARGSPPSAHRTDRSYPRPRLPGPASRGRPRPRTRTHRLHQATPGLELPTYLDHRGHVAAQPRHSAGFSRPDRRTGLHLPEARSHRTAEGHPADSGSDSHPYCLTTHLLENRVFEEAFYLRIKKSKVRIIILESKL